MKPKVAHPSSQLAIVAALVSIVAITAAAVLFSTGDDSLERLAVLVGVVGLVLPSLTATLRSDQAAVASHQAAEQTNGGLDSRIEAATIAAVERAMKARRATDPTPPDPLDVSSIDPLPPRRPSLIGPQ